MSMIVGLGIAIDAVRAVGVEGVTPRWMLEVERGESEPLGDVLAVLFQRAPLPRWPRPRIVVAIGPAAAQVKRIAGLPPISDPAALAALVRECAGRFFLQNGTPLVATGVRLVEPGVAWAAAFEAPIIAAVEQACRAARVRVQAVVPSVVALHHAVEDERIVWHDGPVCAEISWANGALATARRLPADDRAVSSSITPVPRLATLGERSIRFADAYGAACIDREEALVLRGSAAAPVRAPSRTRLAVAATALGFTCAAALIGPDLAKVVALRRVTARLAALDASAREVREAERELMRMTTALGEVAAFSASRRSATLFLRDLSRALPAGSALVALQLDTAGGTLVAIAPRAVAVVHALEQVPAIASPEIVGPVTREVIGGRGLERITVRFRLGGSARVPVSGRAPGGAP
jgi:hypothetical protein